MTTGGSETNAGIDEGLSGWPAVRHVAKVIAIAAGAWLAIVLICGAIVMWSIAEHGFPID